MGGLLLGEISHREFLKFLAGVNVEIAQVFEHALIRADGCS